METSTNFSGVAVYKSPAKSAGLKKNLCTVYETRENIFSFHIRLKLIG